MTHIIKSQKTVKKALSIFDKAIDTIHKATETLHAGIDKADRDLAVVRQEIMELEVTADNIGQTIIDSLEEVRANDALVAKLKGLTEVE